MELNFDTQVKVRVDQEIEVCHEDLIEEVIGIGLEHYPVNLDDMVIIPAGSVGNLVKSSTTNQYEFSFIGENEPKEAFRVPLEEDELENYLTKIENE